MPLDLPDADLAGQLCGCRGVTLQGEGTVQRLLVTAPHTGEWDLLGDKHPPEWGNRSEILDPPVGKDARKTAAGKPGHCQLFLLCSPQPLPALPAQFLRVPPTSMSAWGEGCQALSTCSCRMARTTKGTNNFSGLC